MEGDRHDYDRTMKNCTHDPQTLTCTECGHVARRLPTFRRCKPPPKPAPRGLGDMVADGLASVGITKALVSRVLGKPCGCYKRQAALNKLGKRLGIG